MGEWVVSQLLSTAESIVLVQFNVLKQAAMFHVKQLGFDILTNKYYNGIGGKNRKDILMIAKRDKKGKRLIMTPRDYCVVDIETTGLTPSNSEIIEIAAIRYRDLEKTDSFSTFVKPGQVISDFIVELTGISNEMVADAPDISEAILGFRDFVQDDIIIGYNVNFDLNFLYDALLGCHGLALSNDYVDVLSFARKALPRFERKSQTRVADHLRIPSKGAHRAERDCEICNDIYQRLMKNVRIIQWVEENEKAGKKTDRAGGS